MALSVMYAAHTLRWTVPAVMMVAPSPIMFVAVQVLRVCKPVMSRDLFEFCDETLWSNFQRIVLFFYSNLNAAQVVFSGNFNEFLEDNDNCLVLSNHQTAVDWVLMDMIAVQKNFLGRMRFMLKDELKYIPMFGLYFWQHSCVNVKRYGAFKEANTIKQLKNIKEHHTPTWFVIFPEGTRHNPSNTQVIQRSQLFAENNGFPALQYSLFPRSRGTYLTLTTLNRHLKAVYDVTIGYEDCREGTSEGYHRTSCPSMVKFLLAYSPKIHVDIRRIDMKDVPTEEAQVNRWLYEIFSRKEIMMKRFIDTGRFTTESLPYKPVTEWNQTLPYACFYLGLTACVLAHPSGRLLYLYTSVLSSIAGMVWMAYH